MPVPGAGMTPRVRAEARRAIAGRDPNVREIRFRWVATLAPEVIFDINRDSDTIELNASYRRAIIGEAVASSNDAPALKTLLLVALRQLARNGLQRHPRANSHSSTDSC